MTVIRSRYSVTHLHIKLGIIIQIIAITGCQDLLLILYEHSLSFTHRNPTKEVLLLFPFANEKIEAQRCCIIF